MSETPTPEQKKQFIRDVFDTVATGYDNDSLRLFPFCADRLVDFAGLRPGHKVLDVATGTGVVAVSAAQRVAPGGGRVSGIDYSEGMLDQAAKKIAHLQIGNVDLHVMDAEALEFRSAYFDAVLCSFGVFFLPDLAAGVRQWRRVVRPGGTVAFTAFATGAFQPMADMLRARLGHYGIETDTGGPRLNWLRLAEADACEALLDAAGLTDVECVTEQMGYHLANPERWWELCWNSGYRGWLEQLTALQLEEFRHHHLEEVSTLVTTDGLWMDVTTHFVRARRADV